MRKFHFDFDFYLDNYSHVVIKYIGMDAPSNNDIKSIKNYLSCTFDSPEDFQMKELIYRIRKSFENSVEKSLTVSFFNTSNANNYVLVQYEDKKLVLYSNLNDYAYVSYQLNKDFVCNFRDNEFNIAYFHEIADLTNVDRSRPKVLQKRIYKKNSLTC